ncbi:MAG: sigma-70 family RNA polymerase sigma factor [Planctomycetes bacterium]|nr:sigma-70 family RNA polymerase sigma factor [Planctomycetota bacterium]
MRPSSNGRSTPESLLAQARAGDAEALGRLLEHYRSYLALLARSQTGAALRLHVGPSDLVQDTLLEAHRDFRQFAGASEQELAVWLRRILVRNIADEAKKQQAHRRRWDREESLEAMLERSSAAVHEALASAVSSPSDQASQRELAVLLADALSHLPEDYREVIVMRHLDHRKFEEIAVCMGRSPGAVRKLWTRALVKLREVMEERS